MTRTSGVSSVDITRPHLRPWFCSELQSPSLPFFFLDKVEKVQKALEVEEKWLESACREVNGREVGIKYIRTTLDQVVIGFESRIPALPTRLPTRRMWKQPRLIRTNATDRDSRKRKRSSSCAPTGVKCPASTKTKYKLCLRGDGSYLDYVNYCCVVNFYCR